MTLAHVLNFLTVTIVICNFSDFLSSSLNLTRFCCLDVQQFNWKLRKVCANETKKPFVPGFIRLRAKKCLMSHKDLGIVNSSTFCKCNELELFGTKIFFASFTYLNPSIKAWIDRFFTSIRAFSFIKVSLLYCFPILIVRKAQELQ